MAKHTQTIRPQIGDKLYECVWPFCEVGAKRFKQINYFLSPLMISGGIKVINLLKFA